MSGGFVKGVCLRTNRRNVVLCNLMRNVEKSALYMLKHCIKNGS